jgi:hypothetical protein
MTMPPRGLPALERAGSLQSTTLSQAAGRDLADRLAPPTGAHPWTGWPFSAGRGPQRTPDVHLVHAWSTLYAFDAKALPTLCRAALLVKVLVCQYHRHG